MLEREVKRYKTLNELAEPGGIVVFGGKEDLNIPLGELRQAFSIEQKIYNRSFSEFSITDAIAAYDECIAALAPETLLLHIGLEDLPLFNENPVEFDNKYRELITHIKTANKKCRIAVISLKNTTNDSLISRLNQHLKYLADSEHCEYHDSTNFTLWNLKSTRDVVSFVYSTGFVRPLKNKRPVYDLARILFCSAE